MRLSQNSGVPIYQQIADSFKSDILAGKYAQGVITTMKAYELLEQEGLVTAEQGKGFYVNAQDSEMLIEQHLRKVEASLTEAIAAARIAGLSDDELKNMLDALLMVQD